MLCMCKAETWYINISYLIATNTKLHIFEWKKRIFRVFFRFFSNRNWWSWFCNILKSFISCLLIKTRKYCIWNLIWYLRNWISVLLYHWIFVCITIIFMIQYLKSNFSLIINLLFDDWKNSFKDKSKNANMQIQNNWIIKKFDIKV